MPMGKREQERLSERGRALRDALKATQKLAEDIQFCIEREMDGQPFPITLIEPNRGRPYEFYKPFQRAAEQYNGLLVEHGIFDAEGKRL